MPTLICGMSHKGLKRCLLNLALVIPANQTVYDTYEREKRNRKLRGLGYLNLELLWEKTQANR